MNSILDFDEKLGVMTLEAGVTFQQAYNFLESQASDRAITVIGGTPQGSIIGNTLERGIGTGLYGERTLYTCEFQVVLPNGQTINTGLERFDNAKAARLARWATGPSIDGLFFQSNIGIVTRMTVFLPRKSPAFSAFRLALVDEQHFPRMIDSLQNLRSQRVLESNIIIANDMKLLAAYGQYPWERAGGITPLPKALREQMRREQAVGTWNVTSALFPADSRALSATKRRLRKVLGPLSTYLVFVDKKVDRYKAALRPIWKLRWGLNIDRYLDISYHRSIYRGVPSSISLRQAYWRKKMPMPKDTDFNLDRDHCGCVWVCPELPFLGSAALEVKNILEARFSEFGFDPLIQFVGLSEQTLRAVAGIVFDRDCPGEDERATQCYNGMISDLRTSGYYPYRLGIQSMEHTRSTSEAYDEFIDGLKRAVDPDGILSPGRYVVPNKRSADPALTVSVLSHGELEKVFRLRRDVWVQGVGGDESKVPPWLVEDRFDRTSIHWGVFQNDQLIGAARVCQVESIRELRDYEMFERLPVDVEFPVCVLGRMVISPEARKRGLATRLDAIRVAYAAKVGAKVVLVACPSHRVKGLQFMGFQVLAKIDDYLNHSGLDAPTIMKLDLTRTKDSSVVLIKEKISTS